MILIDTDYESDEMMIYHHHHITTNRNNVKNNVKNNMKNNMKNIMRKSLKNNHINDDNVYPVKPQNIVFEENPFLAEIVEAH